MADQLVRSATQRLWISFVIAHLFRGPRSPQVGRLVYASQILYLSPFLCADANGIRRADLRCVHGGSNLAVVDQS